MDRYTHTLRGDETAALAALPDLTPTPATGEAKMTGTYDAPAAVDAVGIILRGQSRGVFNGGAQGQKHGPHETNGNNGAEPGKNEETRINIAFDAGSCGERGIRTLGGLIAHTRFPVAFLQPLGHLSGSPQLRQLQCVSTV